MGAAMDRDFTVTLGHVLTTVLFLLLLEIRKDDWSNTARQAICLF
jgi:hypothetical protein